MVEDGCFCTKHAPKQEGDSQKGFGLASRDDDCPKGELLIPVNEEDGLGHTACRSFEYSELGNTGTIVAGVNGIWDVVTRLGRCPGIGLAKSYQTYYFGLPAHRYSATGSRAKKASSIALEKAFKSLQIWFGKQNCGKAMVNVLGQKMDQFIKAEFKKIGGQVTRTIPLGWDGEEQDYESNVGMSVPDC